MELKYTLLDVMNKITPKDKYKDIQSRWNTFLLENNKVRIRDAAAQLGTSEASLLSTEISESTSFLNIDNYENFLSEVLSMDKIMLLIRNDSVVHEKTISTKDIRLKENKIIDINSNDLILEFNPNLFKYVFSQNKVHAKKSLRSFQIFDGCGNAVLKIYLKGRDKSKFDRIVNQYKTDYNYELQNKSIYKQLKSNKNEEKNIHLIKNLKEIRTYDYELKDEILRKMLTLASKTKIPIQIYAIGPGTIQYHRNTVNKIIDFGPWINVIDKTFNLHAIENDLIRTKLDQYNTGNQNFYSIKFYDKNDNHILGLSYVNGFNEQFNEIISQIFKLKTKQELIQ